MPASRKLKRTERSNVRQCRCGEFCAAYICFLLTFSWLVNQKDSFCCYSLQPSTGMSKVKIKDRTEIGCCVISAV